MLHRRSVCDHVCDRQRACVRSVWSLFSPLLEAEPAAHARLVASGDELVLAVSDSDIAELNRLLDMGHSPNACSSNGVWTALSLACRHDRVEVVRLLLRRGAHANHVSPNGQLPLAIAASHALADCAAALLAHGASPDLCCPAHGGATPNELAQQFGFPDLRALIREGVRCHRLARLRHHTRIVNGCCRVLLMLYNEVAYRPGNQGFLRAQAEFTEGALRQGSDNTDVESSSHEVELEERRTFALQTSRVDKKAL